MITRTFLSSVGKIKPVPKQLAKPIGLKNLFSDKNGPETGSNLERKADGITELEDFEPYMEEPKRVGMSWEDYAKNKRNMDEKKKALEVQTMKS
jgi:hypothetical protein